MLYSIEDDVINSSGFKREELLSIAVSDSDKDMFVISNLKSNNPGIVIWFAGEEIERYISFDEFFLAMIDYNREVLSDLKNN